MKIAIAPFASPFVDFFFNLATYLHGLGHDVHFLNPDNYLEALVSKNGFICDRYPDIKEAPNFFSEDDDLIRFLSRLYSIRDIQKLIQKKDVEMAKARAFFAINSDYDKILIWNGDGSVEPLICREKGIQCLFFENGYFPQTLQLNYEGVNCKANFARFNFENFVNYSFEEVGLSEISFQVKHYNQSLIARYLKRFIDPSFSYMTFKIVKANYLKWRAKRRFAKVEPDELDLDLIGKFIFFPLQVNSDTQIILNSRYSSMYEVLGTILPELLKTGLKVVIKEHPSEVEPVDYSKFIDNTNTFLLRKYPIDKLIERAEFVVNVNSSVGVQAIAGAKKVLVLGESLYDQAPGAVKFKEGESIMELMDGSETDRERVGGYVSHLKNRIFIQGDWRKPDLSMLHNCCKRILG